ncbi:alpha/beta fold hydrolase [Niabella hibiscisoli]|uniref:alpha/beta fold hydrolase n=1 Tax=Niabella hibiscisoli TaxID=1825928 RepID=UPI001F0EA699|nr:alpha/beta hydrolase [Niabella hibiscisoli]MCH5718779.1 alpha/beta hydrolase [Niabella hibiscisoli]
MKFFIAAFMTLICFSIKAQVIYSKDYGSPQNTAIIFIHGGPSGNSNLFEATTAQALADRGFYVIVYDRRGEGRSKDEEATMTFKESFRDLLGIYEKYHLNKAVILAHSFGGIIATLFVQEHPEKVSAFILAGALFSQQETYDHILKSASTHFKNDSTKIAEIAAIELLGKHTADYRKRCYEMAGKMNFFNMPNPTTDSKNLRDAFEESVFYATNVRNHESPIKFYRNETANNLDNQPVLRSILKKGVPIYAIYGQEDGVFSATQLSHLKNIVGNKNFKMISNCSHYLFVDQQSAFLQFVAQKLGK